MLSRRPVLSFPLFFFWTSVPKTFSFFFLLFQARGGQFFLSPTAETLASTVRSSLVLFDLGLKIPARGDSEFLFGFFFRFFKFFPLLEN